MPRHGTRWSYTGGKCRCEPCCQANDAYISAYRQRNKAKILAKEKDRYRRKDGEIRARINQYYLENKDAVLESQKNPHARRQRADRQLTRVARQRGATVENVDRDYVLQRDLGICGICHTPIQEGFHIDHIVPLSKGGAHSYANVQLAHPKCNERKHTS